MSLSKPPPGLARLRRNLPALLMGFGIGFAFASGFDRNFGEVFWLGLALIVVGLLWIGLRHVGQVHTHP